MSHPKGTVDKDTNAIFSIENECVIMKVELAYTSLEIETSKKYCQPVKDAMPNFSWAPYFFYI